MSGLIMAFQDYSVFKGIAGSDFIGFDNFIRFFNSDYFLRTLKNTLMISFYSLLFAFPAPILLAILLNEVKNKVFKNTVQTLTFLPYFISTVVIAAIVTNFLSPSTGVVNVILEKLGFESIYFLTIPEYFRSIYIGSMHIWAQVGFNTIVYIAAIAGINPALYEAAKMDGASRIQQIIYITIPSIIPTIIIMLILRIGGLMDVGYEEILLLYQPSTYETADIINTYVYREGLQNGEYGLATAAGLFNAIVSLILVVGANKISKKLTNNGLW
ncbi:sugar ABC transporter permease [Oceanobacillus arenosus]|uniref:Sugar ABC transporter permease n=2 Tax=Oceanobacillus arenosus TaxID=1229153 RepID=A0A3D8Q0Z0_9BACI|nr:sugar ABC transporter permease [Oceanobacillus arenosus]